MNAREVLKLKQTETLTAKPQTGIHEAIKLLSKSDQGALVVTDGAAQVLGIISERDIVRTLAASTDPLKSFTVSDLMTKRVVIGLAEDSLECLLATMTEQHIRHLPIMAGGELLGLLSMRDLVGAQSQQDKAELRYLKDYISGVYPG